jgi:elongation factor P hydroxylase
VLAEQLASVDVREFTTIEGLRKRMVGIVDEFLQQHPQSGERVAYEPFYFCASSIVVLPTQFAPDTLRGFVDGLRQVSLHSIHHHFIEARLRLHRMSNDFSNWLEQEVGLTQAAESIERIDIYTNTLEGVRQQIGNIVERTLN